MSGPLQIFLVAGETSGDLLGAQLMAALKDQRPEVAFAGVGGPAMTAQGFASLFPMSDIAVMGFVPVLRRLPQLLRRIAETADACISARPDALILIDSPDFTHRVARRVRKALPALPIIDYVSPTVWAWRPGRAKAMKPYVDHVLALLPFEPAAYERLGGPPCSYVGHPLMTRLETLRPNRDEQSIRLHERRILILPGSRRSEVGRLMPVFGDAVAELGATFPNARFVMPTVPHVRHLVAEAMTAWPVKAEIVEGDRDKLAAFRCARAALAASGTVTLELALAQIPTVAAYRVPWVEEQIVRALVTVSTPVLPSLILGREVIPCYLQAAANADALAMAMSPLIIDGPARARQLADFAEVERMMRVDGNDPSRVAARIVLDHVARDR